MKKQVLAAGLVLVMAMTACAKADDPSNSTGSETVKDSDVTESTTESESAATERKGGGSDFESQLKLLSDEYGNWEKEIYDWQQVTNDETDMFEVYKVAVADLNRNGRLELICSGLHGTGSFSVTFIYEVNESFDGITRLYSTDRDDGVDKGGDFTKHSFFNCYKKDGVYYYAVDDYTGTGWALTEECLYAYSFDGNIDKKKIGGYVLKVEDYEFKSVLVKFYDAKKACIDGEEALNKLIDDYWKDYEKQPCVRLNWGDFPKEDNCFDTLKKSFDMYEEASDKTCDLLPGYKSFHGEDPEYNIRKPE